MSTDLKRRRLQNHGGTPHPEGTLAAFRNALVSIDIFFHERSSQNSCCLLKHALVARCVSPVLAFVSFFANADAVGSGCAGMVEEEVPRLVDAEALPLMLPHALLHTHHRMRYYIQAYATLPAYATAYATTYVHTRCLRYYSLNLPRTRSLSYMLASKKQKKVRGPGLRRPHSSGCVLTRGASESRPNQLVH